MLQLLTNITMRNQGLPEVVTLYADNQSHYMKQKYTIFVLVDQSTNQRGRTVQWWILAVDDVVCFFPTVFSYQKTINFIVICHVCLTDLLPCPGFFS
jgi:hypothetical protein